MSQDLSDAIEDRKYLRIKVTKTINKIDHDINNFSQEDCLDQINSLELLMQKLVKLDSAVLSLHKTQGSDRAKITTEQEKCHEYEENLVICLGRLKRKSAAGGTTTINQQVSQGAQNGSNFNKLKLPEA